MFKKNISLHYLQFTRAIQDIAYHSLANSITVKSRIKETGFPL